MVVESVLESASKFKPNALHPPSTSSSEISKGKLDVSVQSLKDRLEDLASTLSSDDTLHGILIVAPEEAGTTFYHNTTFQWKAMARILSTTGYRFQHWPTEVPFPGGPEDKTVRGIMGLSQSARTRLSDALDNSKQPLRIIRLTSTQRSLFIPY